MNACRWYAMAALGFSLYGPTAVFSGPAPARYSYAQVVANVQPRMVKIFGAGGLRSLEAYQSGFLISGDGFILTAWSYVLDTSQVTVVLDDGRKFTADMVGADPRSEIAILKVDASGLDHFTLAEAKSLLPGSRVLAFSNLYGIATGDEPTSVLHGIVSGVTELSARRGSFETPYHGLVYVLDAMTNNAGAAGGALTDTQGNLAGVLGKELRDAKTNIWLNYAIPIQEIRSAVEDILAGRTVRSPENATTRPEQSARLDPIGLILIPNVLARTPPFVDYVRPGSPAAVAGVRADDLIVVVGDSTVSSQAAVAEALAEIDVVDPLRITVVRGTELLEFQIDPH